VVRTEDTDGPSTVWLEVEERMILGDSRSFCRVGVDVARIDDGMVEGDLVKLYVYEDDTLVDNLLWQSQFAVSAEEVLAGVIHRAFDCSTNFGDDSGDAAELLAVAQVNRSECIGLCDDFPVTPNVNIAEVTDDLAEPDNDTDAAMAVVIKNHTRIDDRIARDVDMFRLDLETNAALDIEAVHLAEAGRVTLRLFNAAQALLTEASTTSSAAHLTKDKLVAGSYFLEVALATPSDFAFYDLVLKPGQVVGDCTPGASQSEACGNCGSRARVCGPLAEWAEWSACAAEKDCTPGKTKKEACGECGERVITCAADCTWQLGDCTGDGHCGEPDPPTCPGPDCPDPAPGVGAACTESATCAPFACESGGGLFTDGYCSTTGCTTDDECGDGGVCGAMYGQSYCLLSCGADSDCRTGYRCLPTANTTACLPACLASDTCTANVAAGCASTRPALLWLVFVLLAAWPSWRFARFI
jgi:hypothetical protein